MQAERRVRTAADVAFLQNSDSHIRMLKLWLSDLELSVAE
jgi:hypothetical protein